MKTAVRHLTAATLVGVGGLHLAWAAGSSFPCATRAELADVVVGTAEVPPPAACAAVAVAFVAGAALVEGIGPVPRPLRRVGVAGVAVVLGARGALGLAGLTERISPQSTSVRFRQLDRRGYSPLCLALAAGAATTLLDR